MDDHQFKRVLDWFGLSWEGYRKVRKGVKKRLSRHMQEHGARRIEDYLQVLEANGEIREECRRLLTVSISRFFRDRGLWQVVGERLLSEMIESGGEKIRVWSAGCACGEEVYSFKIVWETIKDRFDRLPDLEVWATDVNPTVIERARAGVYSFSSLKEVPEEWRSPYFVRIPKSPYFAVSEAIKEGILWRVHDLLSDPPPAQRFHMVFLRNNLLTYYEEPLLRPALSRVVLSLASGGYLIIGSREKLPETTGGLAPLANARGVFMKTAPCVDVEVP